MVGARTQASHAVAQIVARDTPAKLFFPIPLSLRGSGGVSVAEGAGQAGEVVRAHRQGGLPAGAQPEAVEQPDAAEPARIEEAQFETFATQRIRGAMLDELRGNDYLSRGTRKQQRSIESAVHKLEQKLGRAPAESEIAREMGMSLTEYQELLGKVRGTQLVYLEDMSGDEGGDDYLDRHVANEDANPLAMLQDHRMREALVEAIKQLPEREQYVMSMYYEHDMNLKEIAAVLKVTESRVCQLHSQSIARLRVKLRDY